MVHFLWRQQECYHGRPPETAEEAVTTGEEVMGAAGAAAADLAAERQGQREVIALDKTVHIDTCEIAFY